MDQSIDVSGLRKYFAHNSASLVQVWIGTNMTVWTYAPGDLYAAERAARMCKRMGVTEFLHAHKAQVTERGGITTEVIVVTQFPDWKQTVIDAESGKVLAGRLDAGESVRAFENVMGAETGVSA